MALMHKLTVTKPREGRTIAVVGDVYRFLAVGEDTRQVPLMAELAHDWSRSEGSQLLGPIPRSAAKH